MVLAHSENYHLCQWHNHAQFGVNQSHKFMRSKCCQNKARRNEIYAYLIGDDA